MLVFRAVDGATFGPQTVRRLRSAEYWRSEPAQEQVLARIVLVERISSSIHKRNSRSVEARSSREQT
jgi:hypothetical protein